MANGNNVLVAICRRVAGSFGVVAALARHSARCAASIGKGSRAPALGPVRVYPLASKLRLACVSLHTRSRELLSPFHLATTGSQEPLGLPMLSSPVLSAAFWSCSSKRGELRLAATTAAVVVVDKVVREASVGGPLLSSIILSSFVVAMAAGCGWPCSHTRNDGRRAALESKIRKKL
jgi:hypothetical protein